VSCQGSYILGRQDIAEKDLLDIFGLDLGNSINGSCGSGGTLLAMALEEENSSNGRAYL